MLHLLRFNTSALRVEQSDRREFSRDLSRFRSMKYDYVRQNKPVPMWLTDEINKGENDILKIDNTIDSIKNKIVTTE